MQLMYFVALLFSVLITIFAVVNAQTVKVDFVIKEYQVSLALIVLTSALAGSAVLGLLGIYKQIKYKLKLREVNGKNKRLEEQVEEYNKKLSEAEEMIAQYEKRIIEIKNQYNK